jgi:hypothetical protein
LEVNKTDIRSIWIGIWTESIKAVNSTDVGDNKKFWEEIMALNFHQRLLYLHGEAIKL